MAEDLRATTINTYNQSAEALADYFKGIGARTDSIDLAFEFAGNPSDAAVLEIGCGDGRDAKEICKHTPNYLGIDVSEGLIEIAKKHVPEGSFKVADAAKYDFTGELDIIFAFASLLHLNKSELQTTFSSLAKAIKPNGIFYISSKYRPEYSQEIKEDRFGRRLFYFYNAELMAELAGKNYNVERTWQNFHAGNEWFELILRRV